MDTRQHIIQTATKSFLQNGYDNTSLLHIVKECGVTKGAFYHYFKTKDELFLEVLNTMFKELEEWFFRISESCKTFREFLFAYFNYPSFFTEWSSSMNISANMYRMIFEAFSRFPFLKKQVSDSYRSFFKFAEERFLDAQRSGEIRDDISAENFAVAVTVLVEGFILFEVLLEDENAVSARALGIAEEIWKLIKKQT